MIVPTFQRISQLKLVLSERAKVIVLVVVSVVEVVVVVSLELERFC